MSLKLNFLTEPTHAGQGGASADDELISSFNLRQEEAPSKSDFVTLLLQKYYARCAVEFRSIRPPYLNAEIEYKGEVQVVQIDGSLFRQLAKLYFIYGWDIIQILEKRLKYASWTVDKPPGVIPFFDYTKKTLLLIIRNALISIEIKAKKLVRDSLTAQLKDNFEPAIRRYNFTLAYDPFSEDYYHVVGNTALAKDLQKKLGEAHSAKTQLEDQIRDNRDAESLNPIIGMLQFLFYGTSLTHPLGPNMNPLFVDKQAVVERNQDFLRKLAALAKDHFLGLLVFSSLKEVSGRYEAEIENSIYVLATKLKKDMGLTIERMSNIKSSADQSSPSRIASTIAWEGEDSIDITSFDDKQESLESRIIADFEGAEDLSLLAVGVLDSMIKLNLIDKDSFEYPVWFQYRDSLIQYLEKKEAEKMKEDEFWQTLTRISSLLSLTALTPVLGEVTGSVAILLNLGLLYHSIYSIQSTLDSLDSSVKQSLVSLNTSDDSFTNILLQVGFLINQAATIKDDVFAQTSIEVLTGILGASTQVNTIRKAIAWIIYANDIETLYNWKY